MRRRLLLGGGKEYKIYMNVLFFNDDTESIVTVSPSDWSYDNYPSYKYTPIGIVVIPANHNVYGDGTRGIMSVKTMSTSNPEHGIGAFLSIRFGGINDDIDELKNLTKVPYVGNCKDPGDRNSTIVGEVSTTEYSYLPSDNYERYSRTRQCPHDLDVYYCEDISRFNAIPSPYLTNDSRNPAYYQTTSPSSTLNCLADFNGKQNTQIICNLATAQPDWRTASSIRNYGTSGYYPAACCCYRFRTKGTNSGDWYIPTMGELGYVVVKYKSISDTLITLSELYGYDECFTFPNIPSVWSSSEFDGTHVSTVNLNNGYIYDQTKDYSHNVCIPFLRL